LKLAGVKADWRGSTGKRKNVTEITDDAALRRINLLCRTDKRGKAMSYRIAISFAAAAIGSCIATEAIAQEAAGFAGAPRMQQSRAPAGFRRCSSATGRCYRRRILCTRIR